MRPRLRGILVAALALALMAAPVALYLSGRPPSHRGFLVEDLTGDRLDVEVAPDRTEARNALRALYTSGERRWIGGEVEPFDNDYGFRFRPDSVVVAEVTAEGLQAGSFREIGQDLGYWQSLGTIYVFGSVAAPPPP